MAFEIIRKEGEGLHIGEGVVVKVMRQTDVGVLVSVSAPYGQSIERSENIAAGVCTAPDQQRAKLDVDEISAHLENCKTLKCPQRKVIMLRALPALATADEALLESLANVL